MENKNYIISLLFIIITIITYSAIVSANPTASFPFTTINGDTTVIYQTIIGSENVQFEVTTDRLVTCKYSENSQNFDIMNTFDYNFGTIHKKQLTKLTDGLHTYYVGCRNSTDTSNTILTAKFHISSPISAKISISEKEPLKADTYEITLITTKQPQNVPSLSYSYDGISYNPIPLSGSGKSWKGYLIIEPLTGEKVMSFKYSSINLEGTTGTEITSGALLLIDTVKPETITSLDAIGKKGLIELSWQINKEKSISHYKLYKSEKPNIGISDYYKEIEGDNLKFTDTLVNEGKTYYYRIIAVDEAGNEGDLSIEAYSTALLTNSIIENGDEGLPIELHSKVDSAISDIEITLKNIKEVEKKIIEKSEKEKEIFTELLLERDVRASISELESLKKDVENYKLQSLTSISLNNKIDGVNLKINTIKKKVPEEIIITNDGKYLNQINDENVENILFEMSQDLEIDKKKLKKSLETQKIANLKANTYGYNVEIVSMDGSRTQRALIIAKLEYEIRPDKNYSLIISLPQEFTRPNTNFQIGNNDYSVIKEQKLYSFDIDIEKITLIFNENIELENSNLLNFAIINNEKEIIKNIGISGYATYITGNSKGFGGLILGILILAGMSGYFLYIKRKTNNKPSAKIKEIEKIIKEAKISLSENNIFNAAQAYQQIIGQYKGLTNMEKKQIRKHANYLNYEIQTAHLSTQLLNLYKLEVKDETISELEKLNMKYNNLPKKYKKQLNEIITRINNKFSR